MSYNLAQLAENITKKTGEKVEVKGDSAFTPDKIQTLEHADTSSITFLANPKYAKMLSAANAGAVILNSSAGDEWQGNALIMDNPYLGFAIVAQLLDTTPKQQSIIHPSAIVADNAEVHSSVAIGANTVVEEGVKLEENVEIGAGCYIGQGTIVASGTKIWPNVTVYHGITIGENCTVHAQTVIGADGFGYAPQKLSGDQHWHKIPQVGGVVIGDGTEIGASTTIDRGAIDDTIIGKGVIIDNQIQIGHNVKIGDFTAIAASTAIAGSTTIGRNVTIGGHCSIAGHLNIVDSAFITGRTFVISDIKEAGVYSSGMPASSNKEWRNNTARYRKLTELFTRVKKIEKKLGSE